MAEPVLETPTQAKGGAAPVSVLYVSYTGLLDPLGQSQVLQYVLKLAEQHKITLLSYEKPVFLRDTEALKDTEARCAQAGVTWHRLTYHNRPGIPATLFDLATGVRLAKRLARQNGCQVVHCRSYIAGLIGLAVKRATGARFIFDMRGFWPDERVDGGIWQKGSFRYRVFKHLEKRLFLGADHVVSLTKAGVRAFQEFPYLAGEPKPASVIPTCTNLELFDIRPTGKDRSDFVLGYVGSTGSWYMFDDVARVVKRLFDTDKSARFSVINRGDHAFIRATLETHGVDLSRVDIREVPYRQVGAEIAKMDAGVFFIKPVFSKRASCPTRMGEFLACGKPCLANAGVGDVEEDLRETRTGITVDTFDDATLQSALSALQALRAEPDIAQRCRSAAEDRFSLTGGVHTYSQIYQTLAAQP